ncbi:MAG: transglutaminase family protein [Tepidisphaeraceae bacterium]
MTTTPDPTHFDHKDVSRRKLRVRHKTVYTYAGQVDSSKHALHLRPIDDWRQTLISYNLRVSPQANVIEFEDVFGNWAQRFELTSPYQTLEIEADSVVELIDVDPFAFARQAIRPQFPLMWMPWERTMLGPYLAPVELPEAQLQQLYDHAMGLVQANNGDLMETLFAINLSFFREYQYAPGTTTIDTTPFETFIARQGVCQDFANLFITMARLLGIPARYVCGYLFTGNTGNSRAGSDATHAWVQLYIPTIGWKDFDPTNGVLPNTGHIRTGYGRHYGDVSPTSGTVIGANRGAESLTIDVEVAEVEPATAPTA